MEEKLKEIISVFIKKPVAEIGPSTLVGKSAIPNSIMIHRMYAKMAEAGIVIDNYRDIERYETLIQRASGNVPGTSAPVFENKINGQEGLRGLPVQIGIDMESISSMPQAKDFREDAFYKTNFSPGEISYCILQPDPLSSFAGLFAAKEAIVKADNRYRANSFDQIVVDHDGSGKPIHPAFELSISHAGGMAIAVAVQLATTENKQPAGPGPANDSLPWIILSTIACLLAVIALYLVIRR